MRLLTRSDFDGLSCAVLLKKLGLVDNIKFVHPKDIQDGLIEIFNNDILANLPYVKGCKLWFDHHFSETERKAYGAYNGLSDTHSPSATRVIYNYYGGDKKFTNTYIREMAAAVDKSDTANYTIDEVLNPEGWVLFSFIVDPRTGLGRYKDYRISNYQLMLNMVDYLNNMSVYEILEIDDVKERTIRYFKQNICFEKMIIENTTLQKNVIVLDLRNAEEIYTGNRFLLYSLYPDQNISIQIMFGMHKQNIVITCGKSIINKSSKLNIGSLMLKYGGGGHKRVGTCQVSKDKADEVLKELIEQMNENTN